MKNTKNLDPSVVLFKSLSRTGTDSTKAKNPDKDKKYLLLKNSSFLEKNSTSISLRKLQSLSTI